MDEELKNTRAGILAMAGTAFLWSIAGLFIKVIDWNPFAIAGLRSFIASFVILAYLRRPKIHFSFPQVMAAVANASTMLLFVTANKTTTAANAIILQYIAPVITAFLGAMFLKEKTWPEHWFALFFSAVGMVILFMGKVSGGMMLGNVLALLSGVAFSLYFIFMRKQKEGSPLESNLMSHWITAVICLVVSIFLPVPNFSVKAVASIFVLGIVQIGLSSILFSIGIKRVSAVNANLIAIIEPVFNPIWVFIVIGEVPGINAVAGGLIIVASVTVTSIVNSKRSKRNYQKEYVAT